MRLASSIAIAVALVALPRAAHADAKAECVAAVDQGQQLRDESKYRRAREAFVTCARDVCPGVVAKRCTQWLGDLDKAMPTVVLAARDEHGGDVSDVRVSLDGALFAERLDGAPIAIDPGEHVLRFERAGSDPVEQKIVARANEKGRVIAVTIHPSAPVSATPKPAAASTVAVDAGSAAPRGSFFTARNVTTVTLIGLAAVATGGAIYFGVQSKSEADTAAGFRSTNPANACARASSATCQQWSDAVDAQNRDATLNVAMFIAAGALAAGGAAAWLLWPSDKPHDAAWIAPTVAPGRAGLSFGARF